MEAFNKRRGALAVSAVMLLLLSAGAGATGTTYLYSSGVLASNAPPQAQIAGLDDGEVLPAGPIETKGFAADNSKVQGVSIRVDGRSAVPAIPDSVDNDFSGWTVPPDLSPGNHILEVETVDEAGKTNSTKISVVVTDAAIRVPSDQVVEAAGPSGAPVSYSLSTVQKNMRITTGPDCSPASGSMFPIGTTKVTCTATFAANITAVPFSTEI